MEVNSGSGMSCLQSTCFSKGKKSSSTCKKHVDDGGTAGVAGWLCQSVAAAFFASLDWCSCIFLHTSDGPEQDSNHAPLIPSAEKKDSN